jgi:hypothetical protein
MAITFQADLLRYAIAVLERLKIPYLVCGSFASGSFGEPRMTLDIDIVVQLTRETVDALCAEFPDPEFYVSLVAARDAVRTKKQFNVIHPDTGNKIDFMISGRDEWSQGQLQRRRLISLFPDLQGYTASPEDIVISKMRYYKEGRSEKHLRDCAGVLLIQGDMVDRDYIAHWCGYFELTDVWQQILRRLDTLNGQSTV